MSISCYFSCSLVQISPPRSGRRIASGLHWPMVPVLPLLLAWALFHPSARAQDTHYWNLSYGTEATLLGGTVIGSANDMSATYYNPGMLAVNREQGLLLGANIYTFQKYSIEGASERSTRSSQFLPGPSLVAGKVPVDSAVGGVAYSILSRQYFQTSIKGHFVGLSDLIGGDGIPEQVSSELAFETRLSESWVGITLFRLLKPSLGVGLSNYVAVRNQSLRSSTTGSALPATGTLSASSRITDIGYYSVRLIWKFGVGIDMGALTAGMTLTFPSVNLFGSGSVYSSATYMGVSSPLDTARQQSFVSTNQEDLSARYRSSWAIGLGAAYRLGDVRLHLSAEWYAPVIHYDVLDTSPFVGQTDGKTYEAKVAGEMTSVLNAGIGIEYHLSGTTSFYGSLTTDYSALPAGATNILAVTAWNLYHVAGGAVLKFAPFDLTMGLTYAAGNELVKDLPLRRTESSKPDIVPLPDDASVRSLTITGILAISFHF